jgi:hypothetical protein
VGLRIKTMKTMKTMIATGGSIVGPMVFSAWIAFYG